MCCLYWAAQDNIHSLKLLEHSEKSKLNHNRITADLSCQWGNKDIVVKSSIWKPDKNPYFLHQTTEATSSISNYQVLHGTFQLMPENKPHMNQVFSATEGLEGQAQI